jgi:archaellum component FlaC
MNKEIEKLKFELSDLIDSKFEYILRNLDNQTKALKTNYDTLSTNLKEVGDKLLDSFKDKVTTIKTTVATFFAKIDV